MNEKKILLIIVGLTILGLSVFVFWQTKPKPGQMLDDLGRGHIPLGTEQNYNSNPPTSGPHFEEWVKAGIYERPQDDRYLIHSLEHGYVILSYNCQFKAAFLPALIKNSFAHGTEESTPSAEIIRKTATEDASASAKMTEAFSSNECHELVDQLISVYESKGKKRLIIVPRPSLDSRIALTAWRYIDKLNSFDKSKIEKFIDGHLNKGPEKTME